MKISEITSFLWLGDRVQNNYSDVYNKLLESGHSQMTEKEAREYAKMTGYINIEDDIETIKSLRELYVENVEGTIPQEDLISFTEDAYPFEILFMMRY